MTSNDEKFSEISVEEQAVRLNQSCRRDGGTAFSIIILSYTSAQYRIARSVPGWKNLYAVCYDNASIMCYGMADALRDALPEAVAVSKFSAPSDGFISGYAGQKYNVDLMCADSTFFGMFDVKFMAGSPAALTGINDIVISGSFAEKIRRPGEDLLGKSISISGEDFTIKGIAEDFRGGILQYTDIIADIRGDRFLGQYKSEPFNTFGSILTFLSIRPGTDPETLGGKILDIYSRKNMSSISCALTGCISSQATIFSMQAIRGQSGT